MSGIIIPIVAALLCLGLLLKVIWDIGEEKRNNRFPPSYGTWSDQKKRRYHRQRRK